MWEKKKSFCLVQLGRWIDQIRSQCYIYMRATKRYIWYTERERLYISSDEGGKLSVNLSTGIFALYSPTTTTTTTYTYIVPRGESARESLLVEWNSRARAIEYIAARGTLRQIERSRVSDWTMGGAGARYIYIRNTFHKVHQRGFKKEKIIIIIVFFLFKL